MYTFPFRRTIGYRGRYTNNCQKTFLPLCQPSFFIFNWFNCTNCLLSKKKQHNFEKYTKSDGITKHTPLPLPTDSMMRASGPDLAIAVWTRRMADIFCGGGGIIIRATVPKRTEYLAKSSINIGPKGSPNYNKYRVICSRGGGGYLTKTCFPHSQTILMLKGYTWTL